MILNRKTLTSGSLSLLAILFIALVGLSNQVLRGARLDLTKQSLYTLSEGTHNILQKLDEPIHLTLFFSDKSTAESNRVEVRYLRVYFERVRELLEEMTDISNGKIVLEIIDPVAYSEAEDRAVASGIQGLPFGPSGEKIFLGLLGSNATDSQAKISFLDPNNETFLEYDIVKLIHNLNTVKKPSVALLSGLPITKDLESPAIQSNEGWVTYQQLKQLFEVKPLNGATLKNVPPDINVLVVIHPKQLSNDAQYAIDQFVMRGGHLLAFVDPYAENDFPNSDQSNPMEGTTGNKSSDLPSLFKAWGLEYDANQVVLDREHALMVDMIRSSTPVKHPGILQLGKNDLPQNDIICTNLNSIIISSSGAFKLTKDSLYKLIPLLQTGKQSMMIPTERIKQLQDPSTLLNGFSPSGEQYILAARLQGTFKSAFPNRTDAGHLAEAKDNGEIVLIADTDILSNRYWVRTQNFFGQNVINSFANNGDWFINAVDNLSGS